MGGLILFAIVLCIWVFAKQDIKYYPQILFVCMAFTFLLGVINISKENHEIDDENKRIENNNRHIREKNEKVKYWLITIPATNTPTDTKASAAICR